MKSLKPADVLSGNTFSYYEVFEDNNGMAIGTELNGVKYYIYDLYCMNPGCKCDDVILKFTENTESDHDEGVNFAVVRSLKNRKYEILDAYGISNKKVNEILKESLKNSDEAMKLYKMRYKKMKQAGKTILEGNNPNNNKKDEPAQEKTKRNDPCPCGSGKKYKKCCGI